MTGPRGPFSVGTDANVRFGTCKTNPENSGNFAPIPSELPPAFSLPQEFRQSLPAEVQEWLNSVEKRIDGLTLDRIQEEAEEFCEEDPHHAFMLYRLGRRLFYTRMQQIVDIMFPQEVVEIGVDLLWTQTIGTLPGGAVTNAISDGENINGDCLRQLQAAGFAVHPWS
jgi:hypothetical protein